MKDFKMSGANMNQLITDLETVRTDLDNSYELVELLMSRVDTEQAWEGNAKNTFWAYMELLQQYHKCFTTSDEDNPVQMALNALAELKENVTNFYTDYQQYSNMEGIE